MSSDRRRFDGCTRRTSVKTRSTLVPILLVASITTLTLTNTAQASVASSSGAATSDASPVDLATPVDMANGTAHQSAIVRAGNARIEVLSPTLLRLEYSPTGHFENSPTVNALDRRLPVPPYRTEVSGGWLTVRTSQASLRYRVGSGPFTPQNTSLRFSVDGRTVTAQPTWEWECTFDQVCQAGAAALAGGASLGQSSNGYLSTAGYIGNLLTPGSRATWQVLGAPSGTATLTLRYSTYPVPFNPPPARNFDLLVNDRRVATLVAPLTPSANQWADVTTEVRLRAGTNAVEIRCGVGEGCDTNIDTLSVAPEGVNVPNFAPTDPLGGWIRGFDTDTYNVDPACSQGEEGATCQADIEPLNADGLLDRAGWRLLDYTDSAVWTGPGWVQPRPADGDLEDGYLFVYGNDFTGALHTLGLLTGSAPLLPRNVFGVWYSDYTPYSSSTIERSLYPAFESHSVPLDDLSLDTDWKAPNDWNGWEWSSSLFPDASSFLSWADAHSIDVTLNVHSSIDDNDPKLRVTERIAGRTLASSSCTNGPCKVWDWSSVSQAESNFALQQSFERQGVAFWWLDWCCDDSVVSMSGLTPDGWIDHLYAQEMVNRGQRGFVLARIGGSNADPEEAYAAGPWSNHTSTIAFTGDAWGTWNTLAAEAELTPAEASIGEPYVSDDIGSYLGPPPTQSGADPPDLYDRWVQLGTFQPILRLHSNDEDRLPWQYPEPVQSDTEAFLRLRQELVPYTYTLSDQAHDTGLPMARPLYLDDPDQPAAYTNPTEYLFGPDVLVAPITTPGNVANTTEWLPPGRWVDFFTGATFVGPTTATIAEPLDRMPVFVKAGGIVPEQPSTARSTSAPRSMTIKIYPGAAGSFTLYSDAGDGLGYTKGQSAETTMTTSTTTRAGHGVAGVPVVRATIGPTRGRYPGQASVVDYQMDMVDTSLPSKVTLNGRAMAEQAAGSAKLGWSYDTSTDTVIVDVGSTPSGHAVNVAAIGASPVQRSEPTTTASS